MTLVGKNHFIPMVNPVGVQVVRVEKGEVDVFSIGAFFCYSLQREASSELRHSHSLLSSPRDWTRFLGAASSYPDSDKHDPLFCLVP